MDARIQTVIDPVRGCGIRDEVGAIYLVSDGPVGGCGKLPIPLARICSCCNQIVYDREADGKRIKFSRSHRLIEFPESLWETQICKKVSGYACEYCPLSNYVYIPNALLIWIGSNEYYKTPADFTAEALKFGLSRRVRGIPSGFELGRSWVLLAHREAVPLDTPGEDADGNPITHLPGIFGVFKPTRIEVIVSGEETEEEIDALVEKGLTPVYVEGHYHGTPETV